jgi:hypothetical protein
MFISSFPIRHLLNDIIIQRFNKQLLIQSKLIILIKKYKIFSFIGTCFIRYQSQLNVDRSVNTLNSVSDQNEQELGLFKHFDINEQTQQRLKGLVSFFPINNNLKNENKILARGIEYLFPVQYRSYNEITSGKDCIVQARKIFQQKKNHFS